jgi:hypothetical protein
VLGAADADAVGEEAEYWTSLVDNAEVLTIADLPTEASVWVLSLDGQWRQAGARHLGLRHGIWISKAAGIEGGMSGSPILIEDGSAVGVIAPSMEGAISEDGPQARLTAHLPSWFLENEPTDENMDSDGGTL